ncbi:efflux RND transporter permease subunit [Enterobacter cloacae]|uniref:efflux RND transporter permease subunit n=1 Tax=Enterobacter cloacae TaxID=550 RepID=UPI002B1FDD9E|nr:efflux RND transporter permease subunit [Enterobacter cloacae]MEA5217519.1 efflux RND transporter permease subunit [Enterobacter cloacae]
MFSRFFVRRPVFAWVIAILIMLAGTLAIRTLPVAQYPDVAPPSIKISASYPGASAETLENSVTQVIEQQLTGLDHLLYFTSTSSSDGTVSITVTFEQGTDPDTAQVQVQNKVQQAESRLPSEVQQSGVTVVKSQSSFLLIMSIYDKTNRSTSSDVADWVISNLQDPLARLDGVGSLQVFGSEYAMRIWLDPAKLTSYSLMPSDVQSAIEAQNIQVTAGKIGALPSADTQQLTATVRAQSRLQTVEQFRNIIIKSESNGAVVRIGDVARVEMGSEDYTATAKLNGHPAAGMAVMLAPGANALDTSTRVKNKIAEFRRAMPQGYDVAYPKDSTEFIKISVEDVVKTLLEAIVLVVCVMYLFLQNLRATLIPALAVPVVLLGTFGVLALFGYSINTLTLFAMVLAIGLLVDWEFGPESLVRYNGSPAFEIQGENAEGFSSGAAMDKMEELADSLPAGSTRAWSGLSLQEKLASGQAMSLYAISILVVFLCLAALYESWSVPLSVILVIPLGLMGAALAAWMRGLSNDIYFQVALLTTIGLSSKNAILIVEFAEAALDEGCSLSRAALRAAQTRLRPIIMTSLAFIAGVTPLAVATGAGANSLIAIGTGIIGGTLTATLLAVFFVPLFFVLVKRLFTRQRSSQE